MAAALGSPQGRLLLWGLLSILLYWGAGLAVASLRSRRPDLLKGPWVTPLFQALKLAYFLGIPYLALIEGTLSPRLMGLVAFDPYASLGMGSLLTVAAFALLAVDWWLYFLVGGAREPSFLSGSGFAFAAVEILFLEVHWAFYRGVATSLVDDYAGAFLGLALLGVEWAPELGLARAAHRPVRRESFLHRAAMALTITVIYVHTRSFWACLAAHWLLHWGLERWIGFLRSRCKREDQEEASAPRPERAAPER